MPILNPTHPLARLLAEDRRYKLDAYVFVFEALQFAHEKLGMGREQPPEEAAEPPVKEEPPKERKRGGEKRVGKAKAQERHVSGQELCEAIRQLALDQFGLMAKSVLQSWGVTCTGDFGEIVFNLIRIGEMRKTKKDRREDFDNVFDFDTGLTQSFRIELPAEDEAQ